ncbi:hypothetical protein TAMA11512_22410 [Selenomonas sp. TAMA-11512]|uniref:flagellar protein n=1 Tax=Selenomonas sp. TAMA-11512 TaxID=3095337 RepID=UPI0030905504|nr:hypothetical protein TAMA11512_22410 [Selenomonas sp. TAMA-11512]
MAGQLKNCPSCGKLFLKTAGIRLCGDCMRKQQEEEEEILSYVRDNPKSSISKICEALGVKETIVMRMIREGRFLSTGVDIEYPCESCGAPIIRGRFCENCAKDIEKSVDKIAAHASKTVKATYKSMK